MLRFLEALIVKGLNGVSVAETPIGEKVSLNFGLL